jgi:hypothetical protein
MLVAIGLVIAFFIVAFVARKNKATRNCRWRRNGDGDKGNLRMYRCAACGAEAFTATDGPPDTCKSQLTKPGL